MENKELKELLAVLENLLVENEQAKLMLQENWSEKQTLSWEEAFASNYSQRVDEHPFYAFFDALRASVPQDAEAQTPSIFVELAKAIEQTRSQIDQKVRKAKNTLPAKETF